MAKTAVNKKTFLHQQIGRTVKEEVSEVLHLEQSFVW